MEIRKIRFKENTWAKYYKNEDIAKINAKRTNRGGLVKQMGNGGDAWCWQKR